MVLTVTLLGYLVIKHSHAASCAADTNLVNPCRPWFGAAVSGIPGGGGTQQSQFSYLENQVGHNLDTYRQYNACGSNGTGGITCKGGLPMTPGSDEYTFATQGTIVDVNWKPYSDFANVGGGNQVVNNEIATVANNIKAIAPHKVLMTVWWEPQMATNSYAPSCPNSYPNSTGGSAAQYDQMWANVQSIFNQHQVANVVWAVDYLSTNQAEFDCQVPELWPGRSGAMVNWVLFDVYGTDNHPTWASATGRMYSYLLGLESQIPIASLPWGVGEFGTCGSTNAPSEVTYFQDAKSSFDQNTYPKLKLYQIWDDYIVGNGGYACLTGYDPSGTPDTVKQSAFNALATDILTSGASPPPSRTPSPSPTPTARQTSPPPTPDPTPSPPGTVSPGNGSDNTGLTGTVSVALPGQPAQVSVDGVQVPTDDGKLDTNYLTNGSHTLVVTSNGKTSTRTIEVHNRLNPFQELRDLLFSRLTGNHLIMNIGTVIVILLPLVALAIIFRSRIVVIVLKLLPGGVRTNLH